MQRTFFQKYLPTADILFKNIMRGIKGYYQNALAIETVGLLVHAGDS
jgi:hypothetical protein